MCDRSPRAGGTREAVQSPLLQDPQLPRGAGVSPSGTANLLVLAGSVAALAAVPAVAWRVLREHEGRRWVMVLAPLAYLALGNLLSRIVLGELIYAPQLVATTPEAVLEQQRQFLLHTLASMGTSAVLTVAVVFGLRNVLPPRVPAEPT